MRFAYVLSLALVTATLGLAQTPITYVSNLGSNGEPGFPNICLELQHPCLTLQYTLDQTAANGLVIILDALDRHPTLITKPVTIDGRGVGIIEACQNSGLTATNADHVEIRNLAIHVDANANCNADGIDATNTYMTIRNVSITGTPISGVSVNGGAHAVIHGLTVTGAKVGINSQDQVDLTVSDSDVQYASVAIQVAGSTFPSSALIERTRLASNDTGLKTFNIGRAPTVRISDCVIFGNTTGVDTSSGGQIITLRNNTWLGNITDGTTPFSASLK